MAIADASADSWGSRFLAPWRDSTFVMKGLLVTAAVAPISVVVVFVGGGIRDDLGLTMAWMSLCYTAGLSALGMWLTLAHGRMPPHRLSDTEVHLHLPSGRRFTIQHVYGSYTIEVEDH